MLFLATALLGASRICAAPTPNDTYPLTTVPGTRPWNPVEPLQQRIAIINATAMSISWNTYGPLDDTEAVVEYGFDPLSLEYTAGSVQTTFETSRTYSHHATLTNLQPKTVYHYRVAHTNCFGCSYIPTYTFKTPREPGCEEPYTIAVLADMGLMGPDGLTNSTGVGAGGALGDDETNTIQALTELRDDFDSIIHIGDLAYADYFLKETINGFFGNSSSALRPNKTEAVEKYELLNEEFYDQLTPLTAYKPYMVAVGNHESNCVNGNTKSLITNITYTTDYCMPGQTNFTAYAEHWRMPGKEGSESQNFWYSFDDGMVHYVVYDTETDFGKGLYAPDEVGGTGKQMNGPRGYVGEQIEFLKADLAAVDRTATPWVLAFGHRPFYNGIGDALCKPCAKAFEDVLYRGGVDVVMNGHNHVYSQSWPVYKNETQKTLDNPSFPIHITNGAGGHYDGLDKNSNPLPEQIAVGIDGVYGWSRVHFANRTHMRHEFIASRNNTILDTFWLYKEH